MSRCIGTSHGSSSSSSSTTSTRAGSSSTTLPTPRVRVPRLVTQLIAPLVVDFFTYATRPGSPACRTARHAARRRLHRLRRASECFGTSRGSSRGSSRRSSSTTSPPPRVRVSRHVAWLVTRLVAPLVVDYSALHKLVVDYFTYVVRPGASAPCAARQAAHRRLLRLTQARRRLIRLRRAFGCLGMSRGSSRGASSTTAPRAGSLSAISPTPLVRVPRHVERPVARLIVDYFASRRLVVDYFAYAARPGASARRAARQAAHRRLLRLVQACHRLLCLRRVFGFLGMSRVSSRGLSHGSSSTTTPRAGSLSTTLPTPRVRVPRHVARLVTPLVVDYFSYSPRPGASARRATRHPARRRLLHLHRASGCLGTSLGSSRGSSSTTSPRVGSSSTTSPTSHV
jgi:hypothetical protein